MSRMTHKGYSARIEYDDRDGIFVGRIVGINDIIGFHTDTVTGLKAALVEAVDDYLESRKRLGKLPAGGAAGQLAGRFARKDSDSIERRPTSAPAESEAVVLRQRPVDQKLSKS